MADSDKSNQNANKSKDNAGGITNRPLDEEVDNQESLPPRGETREENEEREDPDRSGR